jgi:hypothetical protein
MAAHDERARISGYEELASGIGVVTSGAAVYSNSFAFKKDPRVKYGIAVQAAGTSPVIKVELEEGTRLPATEGVSDSYFSVPDDVSAIIASLADKNLHILSLAPDVAPFGRIKITGLSGAAADSTVGLLNVYYTSID